MRAETNANAFFDPTPPPPHPPLRAVSNVSDCIGTFASLLVKRNTVRIERQKFGYSALLRILRKKFR